MDLGCRAMNCKNAIRMSKCPDMRIEARFADFCRVQCVIVVCATLLGCQKVGFVDVSVPRPEVTVPPTPSAQPVSPEPEPPAVPVPQAVKVIPQALQVGILRFEADSWFKSCFWLTIDGEHSDSTFLGCNKGAQLLGQNITVEIPQTDTSEGSHSKCRMLGFRAEVYRNTENCDRPGSCSSETYAAQPSHVQSTSPVQGRSAFIVQIQGKTASMDARIAFVGVGAHTHGCEGSSYACLL